MPYRRRRPTVARIKRVAGKRFRKYMNRQKMIGANSTSYPARLWRGGASLAKTVGSLVRGYNSIRGIINSELHFSDTSITPTITNTGTFTLLNGVAQGDTNATRTGSTVLAKSLDLRFRADQHISATKSDLMWAIIVVKDVDGTTPTYAHVWADSTCQAFRTFQHSDEFVVLKHGVIRFDSVSKRFSDFNIHIPLNFHQKFGGTGSTISDIEKNAVMLTLITNEGTNVPSITGNVRYKFYDN